MKKLFIEVNIKHSVGISSNNPRYKINDTSVVVQLNICGHVSTWQNIMNIESIQTAHACYDNRYDDTMAININTAFSCGK